MSEPLPLRELDPDQRQLLKEAVCDAVLERTRRIVSGDGELGATITGTKPSRVLSSGFILPRLDENGDDETSDIRIAAHGLDLRTRSHPGVLRIQPQFAVYMRMLPSADDLFARDGRLVPRAELSTEAGRQAKAEISRRAREEGRSLTTARQRAELRSRIAAEVYAAMGVLVPSGAIMPGGDDRDLAPDEALPPPPVARGRLRIPDRISRRYDTPFKWRRIAVEAPFLELPLDAIGTWAQRADTHAHAMQQAIQNACAEYLASEEGAAWAWRRGRPLSEDFWSPENWDSFLNRARSTPPVPSDLIPQIDIALLAQALPEPTTEGGFSIRLALENIRERDASFECGVFNLSLDVRLPDAALAPMRLERVRRSYHLTGFMDMPAIGLNGGVEDRGTIDGLRHLRTTWAPRYVLPRMTPRIVRTAPTAYSVLANANLPTAHLTALVDEMDSWRSEVRSNTDLSLNYHEGDAADEQRQREQFSADLIAWENEARRVRQGIDLLAASQSASSEDPRSAAALPYQAWLLLNRTFARANPPRDGDPPPGWRLFQLAFVLAHLPTLVSRIPEHANEYRASFDEDAASLLYMSTGGGKTEAFFGTVVFALFLDRLRGKTRGVTAMMHYPLRLLTVQQAQRLARLLAHAEMVRRSEALAGAPFEIGFWVGGGNTPNKTEARDGVVAEDLRSVPAWNDTRALSEARLLSSDAPIDRGYLAAQAAWNKLPTCPFCSSQQNTALRLFPESHHRLGIICLNSNCDWNQVHSTSGAPTPLPFLLADTDIYRHAPAVLLGTIDKLALIGQNVHTVDRIAGMFGLARAVEGGPLGALINPVGTALTSLGASGLQPVAPAFRSGLEIFHDPFPSLIIQDEMHLLEESLGTFGGIFETGLFAWFQKLAPLLGERVARVPGQPERARLPHIIGATATVSDAAKHTRALYQRRVQQFPHPGPALHAGFYSGLAEFCPSGLAAQARAGAQSTPRERELAAPWGRVHASLMTNGRLHTVTTISILAAHAATITRWQRDLASGDETMQARAASEIEGCVTDAPYADGRRAAVRAAAAHPEQLAALVDLHRIALTYVTNKKGGDQILAALRSEVDEAHAAMGPAYEIGDFSTELISGGVDIAGIQRVIRSAEAPFNPSDGEIAETLRLIVATSAISHGVDVEGFNAMAFAGMPTDVAEYIQASSRVGRTHVGFSLLIPTPQTRRDRFVVEVHEPFHRLLERMISPPAIERWADRAIARTVPSLVQTWLAGVDFQTRFVHAAPSDKQNIFLPASVEALNRIFARPGALQDCGRFVQGAIGITATEGAPSNPEYYADLVSQEIRRIEVTAASEQFTGALGEFWTNRQNDLQRPMTSLRDVDAAGAIRSSRTTLRSQPVSDSAVEAAMAFVRSRGGRPSAASEMDGDA